MSRYSATYSPDDNKLRLYASSRLDAETYARVKAAGFRWAPKQDLFVAPMWTPSREDLLIELAGEIEDEDKSLVQRAEERAERFEDYSDKRMSDAQSARKAVDRIADGIPMGQPILVGHHSERHARKDAERIESGMRKAVKMWETSKYWTARAAGALQHAKYKELPTVRARRIKTLEAEKRKVERAMAEAATKLKLWSAEGLTLEQARVISNYANPGVCPQGEGRSGYWTAYDVLRPDGERYAACPSMTVEQVQEAAKRAYSAGTKGRLRWIAHYENRLAYERAMLEEAGASELSKPKPRRELAPLLNYRAEGGSITTANQYDRSRPITYAQVEMTKAQYAAINKDYKGSRVSADKSHRFRTAMVKHSLVCVFLTDSKEHQLPKAEAVKPSPAAEAPEPRMTGYAAPQPRQSDPEDAEFRALKDGLKAGVKVVVAPQLFPTPADLAERVVQLAEIGPDHRVLEPSAGTGSLLSAIRKEAPAAVVAVEINPALAGRLDDSEAAIVCGDFLQCTAAALWGCFDRVVMNPPFERGADIVHIDHALTMLKPGGRLVAICANGPRQRDRFKDTASEWIDLPAGSFKDQGTGVNTALVVIDK